MKRSTSILIARENINIKFTVGMLLLLLAVVVFPSPFDFILLPFVAVFWLWMEVIDESLMAQVYRVQAAEDLVEQFLG